MACNNNCSRCTGQRTLSGCYQGSRCAQYDLNNSTTPCSICNACRRIAEAAEAEQVTCTETVTAPRCPHCTNCRRCGCRNS